MSLMLLLTRTHSNDSRGGCFLSPHVAIAELSFLHVMVNIFLSNIPWEIVRFPTQQYWADYCTYEDQTMEMRIVSQLGMSGNIFIFQILD